MNTSEIQAFTYGEIEFAPFVELLKQCGAADNTMFYDLVTTFYYSLFHQVFFNYAYQGCGAGKAVVAAALSGVHFAKCIGRQTCYCCAILGSLIISKGIEYLPSLCQCAEAAVKQAQEKGTQCIVH